MARKITWEEPTDNTVISVEISKSTTIYGTYSVLDTIDATSDGNAKSASNTWVVTYTDTTGVRTDWYKIRFYDGSTYSGYSDPITSEELLRLCTVDDVKKTINTVGRWTDDEIFNAISKVDSLLYMEMGTPLQAVISPVVTVNNSVQTRYYVGERNVYRMDRMFVGTASKQELYLDDQFKANNPAGMVEVLPVASSGVTLVNGQEVEVEYVPWIFHEVSLYRTCKRLLEELDFTSGGTTSKELEVIKMRLDEVETVLVNRIGMQASSSVRNYDKYYGVNRKLLRQDHTRNTYVGSTGW